jgi:phosphatidylserine/phosphatidylglycerophosphate/cardiolipin synthase-like enzyme
MNAAKPPKTIDYVLKRLLFVLIFTLVLTACQAQEPANPPAAQPLPPVSVFFSPDGGCTEAVVRELNAAKASVLVQAYSFTSAPIAKALVDAHKRGVKVEVILDKSQRTEKYSSADFVHNAGIPVRIDANHAIAHNKIVVIDGETVITGSFNFTKSAEQNNAENLLVIRDKVLADKYTSNWDVHVEHSEVYEGRQEKADPSPPPTAADPAPAAVVSEGYVASKNSAVFHKAGCKGATKISEKNLVKYATREEAIQAGKKPCAECNP